MTVERCTLPPNTASVAAARRYVEQVLDRWDVQEPAWTCVQLVSELVTNAVIHARTEFVVEVSRHGDWLRVCVHDSSPARPGVRQYGADATTGRGLRLVESMAAQWGIAATSIGKTVWFDVDLSGRGSAQSWDDGENIDLDVLLNQFDIDGDDGAASVSLGEGRAQHQRPSAPRVNVA